MADPIDHSHTHIIRASKYKSAVFDFFFEFETFVDPSTDAMNCCRVPACNSSTVTFFFGVGEHNLDNTTKGKLESIFFFFVWQLKNSPP